MSWNICSSVSQPVGYLRTNRHIGIICVFICAFRSVPYAHNIVDHMRKRLRNTVLHCTLKNETVAGTDAIAPFSLCELVPHATQAAVRDLI